MNLLYVRSLTFMLLKCGIEKYLNKFLKKFSLELILIVLIEFKIS